MSAVDLDLAVIIPCRNEAEHLVEQLDALAVQEWDGHWEVLLVDNGSTDETVAIAMSHPGLQGRLSVVDATDARGIAAARRHGVEATNASAFVFCDGDDVVAPRWIKSLGDALRVHNFVTGRTELGQLNTAALAATRGRHREGELPRFGVHPILSGGNGGMTRRGWDMMGGFDGRFDGHEDIELSLRLAAAGQHIEFVPTAELHYRYRVDRRARWRQGCRYGASHVRLTRRCRELGIPEPKSHALKSWAWLIVNLPRAPFGRWRPRWTWTLASRVGGLGALLRRTGQTG